MDEEKKKMVACSYAIKALFKPRLSPGHPVSGSQIESVRESGAQKNLTGKYCGIILHWDFLDYKNFYSL